MAMVEVLRGVIGKRDGAEGENRTLTLSLVRDFESRVSTSFTTSAWARSIAKAVGMAND